MKEKTDIFDAIINADSELKEAISKGLDVKSLESELKGEVAFKPNMAFTKQGDKIKRILERDAKILAHKEAIRHWTKRIVDQTQRVAQGRFLEINYQQQLDKAARKFETAKKQVKRHQDYQKSRRKKIAAMKRRRKFEHTRLQRRRAALAQNANKLVLKHFFASIGLPIDSNLRKCRSILELREEDKTLEFLKEDYHEETYDEDDDDISEDEAGEEEADLETEDESDGEHQDKTESA